jgi:membrane protease YdiL (CAAX protease family)
MMGEQGYMLTPALAAAGQDMEANLLPGFTPRTMLLVFFIGGLAVFNILPGLITGFGEEFGHRGFMFPALYRLKPWIGIVIGGLIWYAWHLPLAFVIPQTADMTVWQTILNFVVLGIGSLCAFIHLACVYVKTRSGWVASFAHVEGCIIAADICFLLFRWRMS